MSKLPQLPKLLDRKIYKTGQTRGADDDVIYQNRVSRSSTVLIPFSSWAKVSAPPNGEKHFENGFIALVSPDAFFGDKTIKSKLASNKLVLGRNALVFYETREQWNANNPEKIGWKPANQRQHTLGGQYVARVPATTAADNGKKIVRGFNSTDSKGAGIRLYEYASTATVEKTRLQLEAIFWLCRDAVAVAARSGMSAANAEIRRAVVSNRATEMGLLDRKRLAKSRILNNAGQTVCPLCLKELSGEGFLTRLVQAEGRAVHDLTVTQINLFHIHELRMGVYNHVPYNLGWGHHHCNVVVKDSGVIDTLQWMHDVVRDNIAAGCFQPRTSPS